MLRGLGGLGRGERIYHPSFFLVGYIERGSDSWHSIGVLDFACSPLLGSIMTGRYSVFGGSKGSILGLAFGFSIATLAFRTSI